MRTLKQVVFTGGDNDGYKLEYDYDHEGTLVGRKEYKKNSAGEYVIQKHAKYLVDSENLTGYSQILAEIDGLTGKVKTCNILTDQLAAQSDLDAQGKPTTKLLQTDALGSIRAVSQNAATTGQPATHSPLDYTAFGSLLAGDRSLTNYGFTGQLVDSMMGMQYHRARWLNTNVASFIGADSVFDFPHNFGNTTTYAGLNPLSNIDYSGSFTSMEASIVSSIVNTISSTQFATAMYAKEFALVAMQQVSVRDAINNIISDVIYTAAVTAGTVSIVYFLSKAMRMIRGPGVAEIAGEAADVRYVAEGMRLDATVWSLPPIQRGIAIEAELASTEYRDWFYCGRLENGFFDMVDFQKEKQLVSLKTIDTRSKTWYSRAK